LTASLSQQYRSPAGTASTLLICSSILLVVLLVVSFSLNTGMLPAITSAFVWMITVFLVVRGLHFYPHSTFGPANAITALRASGTAFLAGLMPVAHSNTLFQLQDSNPYLWILSIAILALLALDGVDGYLARRTQLESSFGARFDMEVDAFLALVLSVLIWRSGKAGIWVLGLGSLRYLFILASVWSQPLQGELFPSMRRKVVCVIQIAALCIMLSPLLSPQLSVLLGVVALACLVASFAIDVRWLHQQSDSTTTALEQY